MCYKVITEICGGKQGLLLLSALLCLLVGSLFSCGGQDARDRGRRSIDELFAAFEDCYNAKESANIASLLSADYSASEDSLADIDAIGRGKELHLEVLSVSAEGRDNIVLVKATATDSDGRKTAKQIAFRCRSVGRNYVIADIIDKDAEQREALERAAQKFAKEFCEALANSDWLAVGKTVGITLSATGLSGNDRGTLEELRWGWLAEAIARGGTWGNTVDIVSPTQAEVSFVEKENPEAEEKVEYFLLAADGEEPSETPTSLWSALLQDGMEVCLLVPKEGKVVDSGGQDIPVSSLGVFAPLTGGEPACVLLERSPGSVRFPHLNYRPLYNADRETFAKFKVAAAKWRELRTPLARRLLLLRSLRDATLKRLAGETAKELVHIGHFGPVQPAGEVERWVGVLKDLDIPGNSRADVLAHVGPNLGVGLQPYLPDMLIDDALMYVAGDVFYDQAPTAMRDLLVEWLRAGKIWVVGQQITPALLNDPIFMRACEDSFQHAEGDDFWALAKTLISNPKGRIRDRFVQVLSEDGYWDEKRSILSGVMDFRTPKSLDGAVLEAVKKLWTHRSEKWRIPVVVDGLMRLRSNQYEKGIAFGVKLLDETDGTPDGRALLVWFRGSADPNIRSVADAQRWLTAPLDPAGRAADDR